MLQRYISCMLACLSVYCVQGQLSVDGTIVDKSDHQPLPAVQVQLSATTLIVFTDENGRYHIAGIKPGSYRLIASLTGYIKDSIAINIEKAKVVPSIQLKRNVHRVETELKEAKLVFLPFLFLNNTYI